MAALQGQPSPMFYTRFNLISLATQLQLNRCRDATMEQVWSPSPVVSSDPPQPAISDACAPPQWTLCWIAMKQIEQTCHFSKRRWKNSLEAKPRGGRRSTMGIGSQVSRELGTCAAACSLSPSNSAHQSLMDNAAPVLKSMG